MAYTITEPSNPYLPSDNIFWFGADSTDKNESSFTYRYRLQITGVDDTFTTGTTGADIVGTFRVPPRPITGDGYYSPMAIAKNYVTTPYELNFPVAEGATAAGLKKFRLIYGQEYVDTSTGLTGMDSATGGTYYFWDAVVKDEDYPTYDYQDYILQPGITGTNFLTDGPNARCPLPYDLLYTVIGASAGFARTISDLITPSNARFFQTPSNFTNYWDQITGQDTAGGTTWVTLGGSGIKPDQTAVGTGEFTEYVTTSPTKIGPVSTGDKIEIQLQTITGWAGSSTTNEMWLVGYRTGDVEAIPIRQMDEFENTATNTIFYEIGYQGTAYYATDDYEWIGFAWKNVGEPSQPTISQVNVWTIDGVNAYWNVLPAGATAAATYPINALSSQTRFAYLNVGTEGVGVTGDYSVYVTDVSGNPLTETITYSDDNCTNCTNCDKKQLVWLNQSGGYDVYEFNCLTAASFDTTRQLAERTLPIGYTKGQRGRMNPANTATVSRRVSTQYVGRAATDWLESLMLSPNVYELQSDGSVIPVQIETNSFSSFVTQDKLKVTEFTYTLGYTRKSQIL